MQISRRGGNGRACGKGRFAVFFSVVLCAASAAWGAPDPQALDAQWAVQLGYFANLDNALNLKQRLQEEGFEARVVSTGQSGGERYRVVSGRAETAGELQELLQEIDRRTGFEGFVTKDPSGTDDKVREMFEPPKSRYLVAQAGDDLRLDPSPMPEFGYNAGLDRSPQEAIDSMPGFTAGGFQIVPTIGLTLGYDDNITAASRDELSSWFYMISPAIRAELPSDRTVLSLTWAGNLVRYENSPIDNRETWYLRGDWAWDISPRQRLNLFAQYTPGTDQRGEGRRQGDAGLLPIEPDEWERFDYGGVWDYGAVGSRGRLTLRAGWSDLEYTNNREGEAPEFIGTRFLDRDWWYWGGTFYWRVAPKTSLLADYQYADMSYKASPESDSEVHSWMLGVTWDATARTSGRISYGHGKRRFADPGKEDYSGPVWAASLTWRPRTYSAFTLTGTRSTQEPDGNGDYVLRQDITLSWLHDWADRFGTHVDVGWGQDDYRPIGRSDDVFYWGAGLRYTFNPHLRFGFSIQGYDRSSPIPEFEYQRMVYLLTLEASF